MDRSRARCRAASTFLVTLGTLALGLVIASSAFAKTFTVTRADDPTPSSCTKGDCSLREATIAADQHAGADTIEFAKRLSGDTILLGGESVPIGRRLTIAGPGASKLTVSANDQSRVFEMTGGNITIRGITITAGRVAATPDGAKCPGSSAPNYALGGGILQDSGDLALDRVRLTDNALQAPSGIIGGGGVAMIDGSLSVTHSRLRQNNLSGGNISEGGGIFNCAGTVTVGQTSIKNSTVTSLAIADGGGIATGRDGEVTIDQSTLSHNNVSSEAISEGGGGLTAGAPVTFRNSTISDNTATVTGGGVIAQGAGFENANAKVTFINSTIADNTATAPNADGGGILAAGTGQKLILRSSTLVGNQVEGTSSSIGGNLFGSDSASLLNTIVAEGVATTGSNCDGPVKSSGHDLEDEDTCGFNAQGDRVNKNPKLGNLKNNGGPTETLALKRQSPAIDHAAKKSSPNRDQRGFKRVGKPDIGAYEFGAKP
jgi:hypothetical protein